MKSLLILLTTAAMCLRFVPVSQAKALDPLAFNSAGPLNLGSGTYTIDTGGPIPRWLDAASNTVWSGTFFNQGVPTGSNYWGFDPMVAVFDFDSIFIQTNATVIVIGSNPLALLSRGAVTLNGDFNASAKDGGAAVGNLGGTGNGFGGRGGAGGGKGGDGGVGPEFLSSKGQNGDGPGGGYDGTGAYGGTGGLGSRGNGAGFGGRGGGGFGGLVPASDYGDLSQFLQGGAGGGGTGIDVFLVKGAAGGGGGGGVEVGALGTLFIGGRISAQGGGGGGGSTVLAGGGSGGGFFLHAPEIAFTSPFATLEASGGSPNGAGGRILLLTTSGQSVSGRYAVSQGPSGGEPGVLQFGTLSGYFQLPALSIQLVSNTSQVRICWPTVTQVGYQLEINSTVGPTGWTVIGSPTIGDGTTNCVTDSILGSQRFYRLLIHP